MVYKFVAKNGRIDYIATNMQNPSKDKIESIFKARWSIEVYANFWNRALSGTNTGRAQRNHICMAIMSWIEMHKIRVKNSISLYRQNWEVAKSAIHEKMKWILSSREFC